MRRDETAISIFRNLLRRTGADGWSDAAGALRLAARETEWRRNQPCGKVIAGGRVGCVLTGAVRKYSIRSDGHRQIVDLLVAGDFIGLTPSDPSFSLEAVSNGTRIACFRPEEIKSLTEAYSAIACLVRDRVADAIKRLENHILVQGRTTAIEKVSGYLSVISGRMPREGDEPLLLPVSRYDIADHLGIAVETVSRTMTTLKDNGTIAMTSPRHVEIRNPAELADNLA